MIRKSIYSHLAVYSISHMLVDAVCISAVTSMVLWQGAPLYYILVYNFLAFALQPLVGILTDTLWKPASIAILGCCLVLMGGFIHMFLISILLLGLGNALFHVGGGVFSLNIAPEKSAYPGIFVAPGALGVFVGALISKYQSTWIVGVSFALIICTILLFLMRNSILKSKKLLTNRLQPFKIELVIMILLLLTIAFRSLVGLMFQFEWKSNITLAFLLTIGVVLGKAFGGILSDRFGSIKIGVGGLVLSSVFLTNFASNWIIAIFGVFTFNFTMPITLSLLAKTLGKYKGFAFGLTTLALFIGYFISYRGYLMNNFAITLSILCSAFLLYMAIQKGNTIRKERLKIDDLSSVLSGTPVNDSP